jgi:hypothetical protein
MAYTTIPDVRGALYEHDPAKRDRLPPSNNHGCRVNSHGTNSPSCITAYQAPASHQPHGSVLLDPRQRTFRSPYSLRVRLVSKTRNTTWSSVSGTTSVTQTTTAQRVATESAYAVYRAIVAQPASEHRVDERAHRALPSVHQLAQRSGIRAR